MNRIRFFPPRRRGAVVQTALILLSALLTGIFAVLASRQPVGWRFALYALPATFLLALTVLLVYRLYALRSAFYSLDVDNLTISWGWRVERIPLSDIEWVRPANVLAAPLPLPLLHLPGSILGARRHLDLGMVEFLAAEKDSLLLIATRKRVFAISPEDSAAFLQGMQRVLEKGSLAGMPPPPQILSLPAAARQGWEDAVTRYLWLAGLFLNIGLLVWVRLIAPAIDHISLGFLPSGLTKEAVPGSSLILLPILSLSAYVSGWVAGLFFYRREAHRPLANIVWASGVISTLLFLAAVLLIVTTPV